MAASIRLAETSRHARSKTLNVLIVADMHDPVTPILEAEFVGEGLHDTGRVIARLSEVVHHRAAAICENLLRVGAVEIDLGHVQPRSNDTPIGNNEALASELSSTRRPVVMSGKMIICGPRA